MCSLQIGCCIQPPGQVLHPFPLQHVLPLTWQRLDVAECMPHLSSQSVHEPIPDTTEESVQWENDSNIISIRTLSARVEQTKSHPLNVNVILLKSCDMKICLQCNCFEPKHTTCTCILMRTSTDYHCIKAIPFNSHNSPLKTMDMPTCRTT